MMMNRNRPRQQPLAQQRQSQAQQRPTLTQSQSQSQSECQPRLQQLSTQQQRPTQSSQPQARPSCTARKFVAECEKMCPDDEYRMRVENNLVAALEKTSAAKSSSSQLTYQLIKEYSRPAAGKIIRCKDLRTIDALMRTTNYLINDVYARGNVDYLLRYEFLFDRLRAIRQDLTITRCNDERALKIYETIVAFYILSDYKLCACKAYDAFINDQHLVEVLSAVVSHPECRDRAFFYSLYILLNLGNSRALINVLKTSSAETRHTFPLDKCIQVAKCYVQNNYMRLFRLFRELPLLCQLLMHRYLPQLESQMFAMMNTAYSSKNAAYPADHLVSVSLLESRRRLQQYADVKLVHLDDDVDNVLFSKTLATAMTTTKSASKNALRERLELIDEKLANVNESEFLLDCCWL